MPAGAALRNPAALPIVTVRHDGNWSPRVLRFARDHAVALTIRNEGGDWHLFALGTAASLKDQQQLHRLMPELRKDYPNTRLAEAGQQVSLAWRFTRAGRFYLTCVRAGHQAHSPRLTVTVTNAGAGNTEAAGRMQPR